MLNIYETIEVERTEIPQRLLDLDEKERSNLFPWRGQFSPELVEVLLSEYSDPHSIVLDPFAGVGTTLFEAAKKGMESRGTELNPSAFAMAKTLDFLAIPMKVRLAHLGEVEELLQKPLSMSGPLFSDGQPSDEKLESQLAGIAKNSKLSQPVRLILINILIGGMSTNRNFGKAFEQYRKLILELPFSNKKNRIFHADARQTGLPSGSIDLVITSPPYINVFNYHQNNRPAIIVGRESSVRGVSFGNASLVASLGRLAGFEIAMRQERKFKNKFGKIIFEDILHFLRRPALPSGQPVDIAVSELTRKLGNDLPADVRQDLDFAILSASKVKPSPLYTPMAQL